MSADHQCCGKCQSDKPLEQQIADEFAEMPAKPEPWTSEQYQAAINDLGARLQTADLVIAVLLSKSGGAVTMVDADGESVIGKTVVSEADNDSKTITFRLVDAQPVPDAVQCP